MHDLRNSIFHVGLQKPRARRHLFIMAKKKKIKAVFEFAIKSSPTILYNYISSPSGLSEWFAQDVDINNHVYTFKWEGSQSRATLLKATPNKFVRFHWEDSPADEYFEFEIQQDELTDDVALVITDFVEENEKKEAFLLWESQVHDLKMALGG